MCARYQIARMVGRLTAHLEPFGTLASKQDQQPIAVSTACAGAAADLQRRDKERGSLSAPEARAPAQKPGASHRGAVERQTKIAAPSPEQQTRASRDHCRKVSQSPSTNGSSDEQCMGRSATATSRPKGTLRTGQLASAATARPATALVRVRSVSSRAHARAPRRDERHTAVLRSRRHSVRTALNGQEGQPAALQRATCKKQEIRIACGSTPAKRLAAPTPSRSIALADGSLAEICAHGPPHRATEGHARRVRKPATRGTGGAPSRATQTALAACGRDAARRGRRRARRRRRADGPAGRRRPLRARGPSAAALPMRAKGRGYGCSRR